MARPNGICKIAPILALLLIVFFLVFTLVSKKGTPSMFAKQTVATPEIRITSLGKGGYYTPPSAEDLKFEKLIDDKFAQAGFEFYT